MSDIDFQVVVPGEEPQQPQQNHLIALAKDFGYAGELTVGALEDGIRWSMRRTVEECLEIGKRLLLLKAMTPHGEFQQRVEFLGIHPRMARKFMTATQKFSKTESKSVLNSAGTQSKLLELLVLDDEEIEALSNGETIGELNLDEINCMSVSELKQAIRDRDKKIEKHAEHNNDLENERQALKAELRVAQGKQSMAGYNPQTVAIRHEAAAADYGVRIHVDELTALYESALGTAAPTAAERELRVNTVALAVSASFAHVHALYERLAAELGDAMPIQPERYTPFTDDEKALLQRSVMTINTAFQADKSARATKRKVDQIAKGGKAAKE